MLIADSMGSGVIISEAANSNVRNRYTPPPPPPSHAPPPSYTPPPRYTPPPPRPVVRRPYYSYADAVRIQTALNTLGYGAGTVDGVIGRGTRAAISAFQYDIDASPTGILTADQQIILFDRARVASRNRTQTTAAQNHRNTANRKNQSTTNRNTTSRNNTTRISTNRNTSSQDVQPTKTVSSTQGRIRVQKALNVLGYQAGNEDGRMTVQTREAIKAFQLDISHKPTGLLSAGEREILFRDAADVKPKVSSTQGRIKVQQALNALGYQAGNEDGRMTVQTREAIKAFQLDISRKPTGILSAQEREILFRDAADLTDNTSG